MNVAGNYFSIKNTLKPSSFKDYDCVATLRGRYGKLPVDMVGKAKHYSIFSFFFTFPDLIACYRWY